MQTPIGDQASGSVPRLSKRDDLSWLIRAKNPICGNLPPRKSITKDAFGF